MKLRKYSTNEVFLIKKLIVNLQNGAAQGRWKLADFLPFWIFSTFYKNRVNWSSSGSENWMHNIILKIFGKKYIRKIVKWWCSKPKTIYQKFEFLLIGHFENFQKYFFSKNCYNLYLLIIFITEIEIKNVWFFFFFSNLTMGEYLNISTNQL